MTPLLALILLLVGAGLSGWLGHWAGQRSRGWRLTACALGLLGVLGYLALWHRTEWAIRLFPWPGYLYLAGTWCCWPTLLLLVAGRHGLDPPRKRRAVDLLAVVLTLAWVYQAGLFLLPLDLPEAASTPPPAGEFPVQSTGFTCGSAASAVLLRSHGISASEAELAHANGTRRRMGVSVIGLYWGLASQLEGRPLEARIVRPTVERLGEYCPGLASTRFTLGVDHTVCVLSVENRQVFIYDPLHGRTAMSLVDFGDRWRGSLITIAEAAP